MATIAVVPFVLKAALLSVATDNYEKHVGKCEFDPTVPTAKFVGIDGSVSRDTGAPEWQVTIDYAQDWTTTNSLAQYLLTNAGLQKTLVFSPQGSTAGKPKFTIDALIQPGPIGGAVDEMQTATITLDCVGQPVKSTWP